MQNFVPLHAIESELELPQKFGKNKVVAPPIDTHVTKLYHCYI